VCVVQRNIAREHGISQVRLVIENNTSLGDGFRPCATGRSSAICRDAATLIASAGALASLDQSYRAIRALSDDNET
jgi:hypothetical protein